MVIFLILLLVPKLSAGQDECTPTSCSDHGPTIRFPFRLNNRQPQHCGYPGFNLSCSQTNDTVLDLPFSVKVFINYINYTSQSIHITDPDGCFPSQLRNLNLSSSPFQFSNSVSDFSLFSCPAKGQQFQYKTCIPGEPGREVIAVYNDFFIYNLGLIYYYPLLSCRKLYNISSVPSEVFDRTSDLQLKWSKQICGNCEAQGKYCRLKISNSTGHENFECFGFLKPPKEGELKRRLVIAGAVVGSFFLVVVVIALYCVHRAKKIKREDQFKIESFLEDYRALKPSRYSYADLKKITNQFIDKVGQGGYGTVYKGQLSNDVYVAVKILNSSKGKGEDFINEVGIIGRIHHINVVRLVGYCADGFRRALIYEFLPNDSLQKFVSSDHEKGLLGWKKLQDIAIGIAKGIEYLHQGCDQRILHFDIKPHNILLDHNLNPKISDFGQAKLCSKEQSIVSMTTARGTIGYIAPEVFSRNFGNVSYKSDIYSFGMLLLEMVGEKKDFNVTVQNTNQVYFPEWIYNRLHRGEELGIQLRDDADAKIAKKLAIVGLWCIQWYPVDRPSMNVVVKMLEDDEDTLIMPANPFSSTNPTATSGVVDVRPVNNELEIIVESEIIIESE
ncbi:hypothetical protein ACSBR1_008639 [Camellia fascicularis]